MVGRRKTRQELRGIPLTAKEVTVLRHVARGLSMEGVAQFLRLRSKHTAISRMKQVYAKLGADNAAHAVMLAVQAGWLHPIDGTPQLPPVNPKWYAPKSAVMAAQERNAS